MIVLILINKSSLNLKNKGNAITYIKDDFSSASQVLLGPTFIGLDKEKKPFKISAAKATKLNNSTEVFDLEEPKGEITNDSDVFYMSGNFGVFNKSNQFLEISGDVTFSDKKSFTFNTSEAEMDFKKEVLLGHKKVTGKKKNSHITSEGFKILNKGDKIIFTGKSKLLLSSK